MKNYFKRNQWSQGRKSKLITACVGLSLRVLVGLFAITIGLIFFQEMTENSDDLYSYALCATIPLLAVVVSSVDVYMHYKLDIVPLRKKKKEQKQNPLEFK